MRSDRELDIADPEPLGVLFPAEQQPGVSHSGHERNHLFMNREGSQFIDISGISGLDDDADGRAFALLDYDRDGWQDIAVVNANTPLLRLYRNRLGESSGSAPENGYLAIRLVGGNWTASPNPDFSNRDGIGARVSIELGEQTLQRELNCGEGLAAQNTSIVFVGIGSVDPVPAVTVRWPSGRKQRVDRIPARSLVTIFEDPSQNKTGADHVIGDYLVARPQSPSATTPASSTTGRVKLSHALSAISGPSTLHLFSTMATWCALCKGELPQFERLRSTFGRDVLSIQAVPIDPEDNQEKLIAYMEANTPAYELAGGLTESARQELLDILGNQLQIQSPLPASLVTDSKGHVLLSTVGVPSVSDMSRLLDQLADVSD